jgi:hypothetical protein
MIDASLPLPWVSTGVKAGNNRDGVLVEDKEQRVGKATQQDAAHATKHEGELQGVAGDTLHSSGKLDTEPTAKAGALRFIPVLRGDNVRPRG